MKKTLLYARESVAFDEVLSLVDADGVPIDITGWTFSLDLMRQAGSPDLTLDMNPAGGDGGFAIVDGGAGELRMIVLQASLAGVDDTTGDFTLFGDLLGAPSGVDQKFIADMRLNVTTAGGDFGGSTAVVAVDAIGAVLKEELSALVIQAESATRNGRAYVAGKVASLVWSTSLDSATPTVTLDEGLFYEENNGGTFKEKIAPVAATQLSDGHGLVVDFANGPVDGSGRYIPQLVAIASGLQTGWQTARKYVLIAKAHGKRVVFGEYRLTQEVLTDASIAALASSPAEALPAAIDLSRYGLPEQLAMNAIFSPSTGLTFSSDGRQITAEASTGRIYFRTDDTWYTPRFSAGDTLALWFRVLAGTPSSVLLSFYAADDTPIGAAIQLQTLGPFRFFEGAVPANADYLGFHISNVGGANPLTIEQPTMAVRKPTTDRLPNQRSLAFDSLRAAFDIPEDITDLWPDSPLLSKITGNGAAPSFEDETVILAPTDSLSGAKLEGVNFPVGTKLSWLVHLTDQNRHVRYVAIKHSRPQATETFQIQSIGDGWFYGVTTVTDAGGGASAVQVEIDNRSSSFFTPLGDIRVDRIVLMQGDVLPHRLPSRASIDPTAYDADEIVVTQAAGEVNVFVKGSNPASAKYIRYRIAQYDLLAENNGQGWRWAEAYEATRTGDTTFATGKRILNGGENWLAIREANKSDFMGGAAHGDTKLQSFTVLVDGVAITLDGVTSYRGRRIEFLMRSQLVEADVAPATDIPTFDVVTTFAIDRPNGAILTQLPVALRTVDVVAMYLAMLSFERHENGDTNLALLSDKAFWAPDYVEYDVSAEGHAAPTTNADRIILSGPSGFSAEVEILKGWVDDVSQSFVHDSAGYNKLYFSPTGIFPSTGPGFTMNLGDFVVMKARYRIDTRN